ncbi:MAG: hypothetical protein U0T82_17610 [Bacteroidales bacterium]
MIRFLEHLQIDQTRWDQVITSSPNRLPYACSWYLNLVAPGWCALVQDEYTCVMPLPVRLKYGLAYVPRPPYTQQLGIFGNFLAEEKDVNAFLSALPTRFKLADFSLNAFNPMPGAEYKALPAMNMELDLRNSYEVILKSFSENTRRNIGKAQKAGLKVLSSTDPDFLLDTKWNNRPASLRRVHWELSARIVQEALRRNAGEIWEVIGEEGEKLAAVFFLCNDIRKIYLISASNTRGKECGAMFVLVDEMIRSNADKPLLLDFEGSSIPGIARFFKGFGAVERPFPQVRISRLPWPVNRLIR